MQIQPNTETAPFLSSIRVGGIAAIGMALCYIAMAVIFFGLLTVPPQADIAGRIAYMQQQQLLVSTGYSIGYLLFGVLLAILLQALQQVLAHTRCTIAGLAGSFGLIWVMLMMASGMTALVGLDKMFSLLSTEPVQAIALYHSSGLLTNALGGGIELVGGLWVLLLSSAGLKQRLLPKALHLLGLLVGSLGIISVWHTLPYIKDGFGLLQLIWFIWFGVVLCRRAGNGAQPVHQLAE